MSRLNAQKSSLSALSSEINTCYFFGQMVIKMNNTIKTVKDYRITCLKSLPVLAYFLAFDVNYLTKLYY